jgi:hypothetical protein
LETKEQIREALLKDPNCYSVIGITSTDGRGFHITSNPDKIEHSDPNERDFNIWTGLGGAVDYISTFQESIRSLSNLEEFTNKIMSK